MTEYPHSRVASSERRIVRSTYLQPLLTCSSLSRNIPHSSHFTHSLVFSNGRETVQVVERQKMYRKSITMRNCCENYEWKIMSIDDEKERQESDSSWTMKKKEGIEGVEGFEYGRHYGILMIFHTKCTTQ